MKNSEIYRKRAAESFRKALYYDNFKQKILSNDHLRQAEKEEWIANQLEQGKSVLVEGIWLNDKQLPRFI